ncbi:hypothetical protein Tco_1243044 [Tanacetum coccineum]
MNDSLAKRASRTHDPLALIANSYAFPSYTYTSPAYYVTHAPSEVDAQSHDFQRDAFSDDPENTMTTTMMLLARELVNNIQHQQTTNFEILEMFRELMEILELFRGFQEQVPMLGVEQFFQLDNNNEAAKVPLASIHMFGRALNWHQGKHVQTPNHTVKQPTLLPKPTAPAIKPNTTLNVLTSLEMDDRRSKGLCFNCDDKYVFGHICKGRKPYLCHLQLEEGDDDYENEDLEDETQMSDDIQAKIEADHELAERLQAEEQEELSIEEKAKLFQQLLEKRRKHFAAKRAEDQRNKPPTQAQQRKIMCTYLKNMEGKKLKDLKNKSFDFIQKMFDKAFNRVNTFIDFRADLVEGGSKRTGEELEQQSTKKQKVDEDKDTTELQSLMEVIPDEEEVEIDAVPLATKSPITAALIDVNAAQSKLVLLENFNENYSNSMTTAWNEFSSTMASAIICLATNQKFNFSKYIFESMVRNLDNLFGKFLMYPRFIHVFLNKRLDGLTSHKRIYNAPSHTKKIFGNMRRVGKDFFGKGTDLFPTMLVQNKMGEGSAMPTDPQHIPTFIQSSPPPQKTQKPRKPKRKDTQVPQPSDPTDIVADEAVHKELGDRLVRAATTASSLEVVVPGAKKLRGILLLKLDMDQDSAHMVDASKVLMLKPGEFELWRMRIEQYIQMIDYALWEVIENGATLPKTVVVELITGGE